MSTLLHNACQEAKKGNESLLQQQVRFMGNKLFNEICEQEAVYLVQQLPLTKKVSLFINTSKPDLRTHILNDEENMKDFKTTNARKHVSC